MKGSFEHQKTRPLFINRIHKHNAKAKQQHHVNPTKEVKTTVQCHHFSQTNQKSMRGWLDFARRTTAEMIEQTKEEIRKSFTKASVNTGQWRGSRQSRRRHRKKRKEKQEYRVVKGRECLAVREQASE